MPVLLLFSFLVVALCTMAVRRGDASLIGQHLLQLLYLTDTISRQHRIGVTLQGIFGSCLFPFSRTWFHKIPKNGKAAPLPVGDRLLSLSALHSSAGVPFGSTFNRFSAVSHGRASRRCLRVFNYRARNIIRFHRERDVSSSRFGPSNSYCAVSDMREFGKRQIQQQCEDKHEM
jgi:hypothetical protein